MSQKTRGKRGVNDECWCGSGLKYKKCHFGSSEASRPAFHEAASVLLETFKSYSKCHAPVANGTPCVQRAIRSHSISKMSALALIARDGHVYQPQTNPFEIAKGGGKPDVRLIGIQNASVFSGFCRSHDHSLFEEVDVHDFASSESAIFALHYRALCKELSAKTPAVQLDSILKGLDRGLPEHRQQALHEDLNLRETITSLALSELHQDKAELDEFLLTGKSSELHSCVIMFSCVPVIACSGYLQPVFDFAGDVLQDLNDITKRVYNQAFTVLPRSTGQIAVLSWLGNADVPCRIFAQSLLSIPDSKKATAVLRYIFNGCENFAASPDWWEALSAAQRQVIDEQMQEWIGPTPFFHVVDKDALRPTGSALAEWKVTSQKIT